MHWPKRNIYIQHQNQVTSDKAEIKYAFLEYYRNLFSGAPETFSSSKWQRIRNRLPQHFNIDTRRLEEQISLEEMEDTVSCLPAFKYPGPNVITGEFYKQYQSSVCSMLHEYFFDVHMVKRAPASVLRGYTVLIFITDDKDKL